MPALLVNKAGAPTSYIFGSNMYLEGYNNKFAIGSKEFGTAAIPAVLKDPSTSNNEDVINLSHATGIAWQVRRLGSRHLN